MSNIHTIHIPAEWSGMTLHSFLRQYLNLSRTGIRSLKRHNAIQVNGHIVTVRYLLQTGDILVIAFPETPPQPFAGENIPLDIVYEDSDLIVINKPAGMVVHPTMKHRSGTLANALRYHWETRGENAGFHPVHRLDRLTSGLILIAKNAWAHQQLDLQIESNQIHRLYLAICEGEIPKTSGRIDAPILSLAETPKRQISALGKPSITRFRSLIRSSEASLLAVKIFTGRTHQIRVHLSHTGHPLWGDTLYDSVHSEFHRPALHAALLSFIHPRTRKRLRFRADIPEDLYHLLKNLLVKM
ncbi:MAG TPA: RluA family pseudouridine synthase [Bacillota bacterium]|nr:RluA family pseudouridine synthase [Bacillota bacterium]HPT87668.1 RluA family pseudouridine synthase [Bacillota bacterium]